MRNLRLVHTVGLAAVTVVTAYVFLHYSDYVYKFQALSFFGSGLDYFVSCLREPGGLLLWAGRFLTQCCALPALGALLLALVAAGTSVTLIYGVRCQKGSAFLGILPSLLVCLFIARLGYRIFLVRADALIFTQPLGLLISSLLFFWLQRTHISKYALAAAIVVLGYPLFGFYALLPVALYAIRKPWCLLLVAIAPFLYYLAVYDTLPLQFAWLAGTPFLDFAGDFAGAWPLLASWLAFALACAVPVEKEETGVLMALISLVVYGACILSLYQLPCRLALFHWQMKAERELEQGRWSSALVTCTRSNVTNDILIAYRNIALYNMGRLKEDCVKYSFDVDRSEIASFNAAGARFSGPTTFYYSGLLNFCSRWCMDLNLWAQPAVERYKYLAKVSLIEGEYELAMKYIDKLATCPFQRKWAGKYAGYARNPETFADDPEYKSLKPLQAHDEGLWISSDDASTAVLMFYARANGDTPEFEEWHYLAKAISFY